MILTEIQYISDEEGNPTGVIVPISLWREIASKRETAHLLRSETMKRRLLEARIEEALRRDAEMESGGVEGIPGEEVFCRIRAGRRCGR